MSNSRAYNKIFGSDIFNTMKTEEISKRNEDREKVIGKNNDIFNCHEHPRKKRDIQREKIIGTNNDIFNRTFDAIRESKKERKERDAITKGADIFNPKLQKQFQENQDKKFFLNRMNRKDNNKSDIFNTITEPGKARQMRNNTQSDIFFAHGKKNTEMFPKKKQFKSNYNPDDYLQNNKTSYDIKMNELYGGELEPVERAKTPNHITSTRGFCEFRENTDNSATLCPEDMSRSFKKHISPFECKTQHMKMDKPREMMVKDMTSNIFNDKDIERKNRNVTAERKEKPPLDTRDLTQPKRIKGAAKWVSNMDWKSKDGALIFKTYIPKNDVTNQGKSLTVGDKEFAFKKKKIDDSDSFNPVPYKTKTYMPDKNCRNIRLEEAKMNNAISKKIIPRNRCTFEKVIRKPVNYPTESSLEVKPREKTYIIKNGVKINSKELEQYYRDKGLHIYNIKEPNTFLKEENDARNTISFNIREQGTDCYKNLKKASEDLKNKYKGIEIVPMRKIEVNRKRELGNNYFRNKESHKLHRNANMIKENLNTTNYKPHNEINSSFTKKFIGLDHRYKSDTKRLKEQ